MRINFEQINLGRLFFYEKYVTYTLKELAEHLTKDVN